MKIKQLPKLEARTQSLACLQEQQAYTGELLLERLTPEQINTNLQWNSRQ